MSERPRQGPKNGCLKIMLISFMVMGAALILKTAGEDQGAGVNQRGLLYMILLPGTYLVWIQFQKFNLKK